MNRKLVLQNMALSEDPDTGLTTRNAVPFELEKIKKPRWTLVFFCDYAPEKLRRLLHLRDASTLLRARWSDNVYVFLCSKRPFKIMHEIKHSAEKADIPLLADFAKYSGDIAKDVGTCQAAIQARQEGYMV